MFSGLPSNLFSILTNVVFISSFVYLCYNMCIFSHCEQKLLILKKPNKTQKNPTPTLEKVILG